MKQVQFNVDYSFCPKDHPWIFVPSSTLYSDVFYCENCDCFYFPSVEKLTKEKLNREFSSDRANDIIKQAKFIQWKNSLRYSDMKEIKDLTPSS